MITLLIFTWLAATVPAFGGVHAQKSAPVPAHFRDTKPAFTYEDLERLIQNEKLTDVSEVLHRLPKELRSNYTFMRNSRSLQQSSDENPRAILFGTDGKLILSFNGAPAQRRNTDIELIQYRDDSKRFEFRTIHFTPGQPAQFSGANPTQCLGCHGFDPRPIWGSDPIWPGAYGDSFYSRPDDEQVFRSFLEKAKTHPRYSALERDPASELYPYAPSSAFGGIEVEHRYRPNHRFGQLLVRLNADRIADRIVEGKFWKRYRYSLLSWLMRCEPSSEARFAAKMTEMFREHFPEDQERSVHAELKRITNERFREAFVIEKIFTGLSVFTWNLSVRTSGAGLDPSAFGERFTTGELTIDDWIAARLLERMAPSDPALASVLRLVPYREVFDGLKAMGAYDRQITPGGVGEGYDRAGLFIDRSAYKACGTIAQKAARELASPFVR